MSFQSDLLCQEDQTYLLENVDVDLNIFAELEEETLAVDDLQDQKYQIIPKEVPTTTILTNKEYNGPYDFEVDTFRPSGTKNPWVYSPALNKVYMDMRNQFPVDFRVKFRPSSPLFIRVTPMYSSPQFAQECVYRCTNHEFNGPPEESNHMKPHVIRSLNPQAMYLGDKSMNERLSLLIPFSYPQAGTDHVREMFEFLCKNSCPSPGMNRRAIEVVFTLENESGNILGRKSLNVRVCSCPKRDKEKDEKDNAGKPPPGKKRKLAGSGKRVPNITHPDSQETCLKIPVVGKHNIDHILKYCQDLYSGEILRHGNGAEGEQYKQALNKINAIIREHND